MTEPPHDDEPSARWSDTLRARLEGVRNAEAQHAWARWEAAALRELSRTSLDAVSWPLAEGVSLPPLLDAAVHAALSPELSRSAARGPLARERARPWKVLRTRDVLQVDESAACSSWEGRFGTSRVRLEAKHVEPGTLSLAPWVNVLASGLDREVRVGGWSHNLVDADVDVIVDPVAAILHRGGASEALAAVRAETLRAAGPRVRFGVCTRAIHEAGGDGVDELAVALGQVAAWLRAAEALGRGPAEIFERLEVSVAIGREPFVELAKLRAIRGAIAALASSCGLAPERAVVRLVGHGSLRELTRRDPWVNLLRGTLVGLAGVLGGVDALEILPLDVHDPVHGEFGARMAIATHLLLRDEAHLAVTADPTAGSYAIEAATEALASAAWQRFRELEAGGGLDAWLGSGALHASMGARAAALATRVREGSLVLLGSNLHPPRASKDEQVVPKGEWTMPAPSISPTSRSTGDVAPLSAISLEACLDLPSSSTASESPDKVP